MKLNEHQAKVGQQLRALSQRLLIQARNGGWSAVQALDVTLAATARRLAKDPELWQALEPVRQIIRAEHAEARELCRIEMERSLKVWQAMRGQSEGLRAYEEVAGI
ncbi:hypothetical protein [Aeromonas simiae]|uniref:hypothetical protein n=1 Tax=Aeromonas simiae TaxID=218936 RepID=UPI000694C83B|nr:hypothetical protein [Aeromonas simiae]MDO2947588.1 hypothetical protein [Aeromonas simiae]MDO2951252.1 hypothetical protein [Aeromonas simiae]MDO2955148.1 hypothetical protein [Aeromonas simiae]